MRSSWAVGAASPPSSSAAAAALDATDEVLGGCWATDHRSLLLKKEDGSDWW